MENVARHIESYVTFQRVEGRSEYTADWHRRSLAKLQAFLSECDIEDVASVTRAELRAYVNHLQTVNGKHGALYSPHSIATFVRSMRAFFAWLTDEDFLDVNPAAKVRVPDAGESDITIHSVDTIRRMCASCSGSQRLRDRAIILTLYDTGIRASELCNATIDALSDMPPTLRVYGKGRKYRTVGMGRTTARTIRRYLRQRKHESDYLFVNKNGEPLTRNGLRQLVHRRGLAVGVGCYPHQLRHTFAITYLRNGGDVFSLQRILGHTSLEMVRHYARLADADVVERHREFSPGDRLRIR